MSDSKLLRDAAAVLLKQADTLDGVKANKYVIGNAGDANNPIPIYADKPGNVWDNLYANIPVPAGLVTKENPYGVRPDIGSVGWQIALRTYARRDGHADRNKYIRERGLTPLWADDQQPFEAGNV